ncbi:MAG TPA: DMT family transporter [Pseudonocardiaceae bacterium]|nr:DMT family transporter [Pseudonocardiaceae bacterium]
MSSLGNTLISASAALVAGMCLAATGLLQQGVASKESSDKQFSLRLIADLVRNRTWLAGIGAAVASYVFQAVALATGPLSLVQPLVVSELLFAIPISARRHQAKLGWREWAGLLTVTAGLVVGIVAANPHRGHPLRPFSSWIWALVAVAVIAVGGVLIGKAVSGPARASLFALSGATVMALQSALYATTIAELRHDIGHTFATWQPYALIVASFTGLFLVQNAYQAGPLAASMPVMDAVLPMVSIGLGVGLFGEHIRTTWFGLAGAAAGFVALVIGIVMLDTSPVVRRQQRLESRNRQPTEKASA